MFRLLAVLIAVSTASYGAEAGTTLVGVLDDVHPCEPQADPGVRPLFVKTTSGWTALDNPETAQRSVPEPMQWTAFSHGKVLGKVISRQPQAPVPYAMFYTRDYAQLIVKAPGRKVPNAKQRYAGWCEAPKYEPLLLVNRKHLSDPEQWQRVATPQSVSESLVEAYRKAIPGGTLCHVNDDLTEMAPFTPTLSDFAITQQWRAHDGRQLLVMSPRKRMAACGSELGEASGTFWFLDSGAYHFLGKDLEPVAVADLDGDGTTEWLYWTSGYNRDGYYLWNARAGEGPSYTWNYH